MEVRHYWQGKSQEHGYNTFFNYSYRPDQKEEDFKYKGFVPIAGAKHFGISYLKDKYPLYPETGYQIRIDGHDANFFATASLGANDDTPTEYLLYSLVDNKYLMDNSGTITLNGSGTVEMMRDLDFEADELTVVNWFWPNEDIYPGSEDYNTNHQDLY